MKSREELNALREEVAAVDRKLAELTEEELQEVLGGANDYEDVFKKKDAPGQYEFHFYTVPRNNE